MSYRCPVCGLVHEGLPDVAFDKPYPFWGIPEEQQDTRTQFTADTCIIDSEDFFIRGVIEIPVHDYPERFAFGVWISLKEENFWKYVNNFESAEIGPFFGWLSTEIDFYPKSTFLLKTRAHFRGGSLRPYIELEPSDHPLALDQGNGISLERAWEIVHHYDL